LGKNWGVPSGRKVACWEGPVKNAVEEKGEGL